MLGAHYLENVWRYSLDYNRAPMGNGIWGICLSSQLFCSYSGYELLEIVLINSLLPYNYSEMNEGMEHE